MESIRHIVRNYFYIIKLMWRISRKRVVCTGLRKGLGQFEYLFFHGFFLRKVLVFLEAGSSYREVAVFLFQVAVLFLFVSIFNSWYENRLIPVTDVEVNKGLYHLFQEKACNVDMALYDDEVYFDKYEKVLKNGVRETLLILDNFWSILTGTAAAAVSWYMMVRLDSFVVLFILAPLIGNFVFAESLNGIACRMYEESAIFRRITAYVNRIVYRKDCAKELRRTDIFHVLKKKQERAEEEIIENLDRYATKNILLGWGYLFFTFTVMFEGVIFYGVYRCVVSGTMLFSQFVILLSLMTAVSWILVEEARSLMDSFQDSLSIQELRGFMEYRPKIPEDADGLMPDKEVRLVEFKEVSLSYGKGKKPVLKNISFCLAGKETCALVGYNGAGKTTLIKLLLRFYDPTEGVILVNGTDIREYNLKAYRKLFAADFQEGKIFAFSLRENVGIGREKEEAIQSALCSAGLKEFVEKLPMGFNTVLTREAGEDGVELSDGLRQRLLAARVFASDAPICVFDEPTSALDPAAEYQLMEGIKKTGENKTVLLISHRLSCVQEVQKILFLDNGQIVDQGTHRQLMERNGEYADLYRMQAEEYRVNMDQVFDSSDPGALMGETGENIYKKYKNADPWWEVVKG